MPDVWRYQSVDWQDQPLVQDAEKKRKYSYGTRSGYTRIEM